MIVDDSNQQRTLAKEFLGEFQVVCSSVDVAPTLDLSIDQPELIVLIITKPIEPDHLRAEVKRLLTSQEVGRPSRLTAGNLVLDIELREAKINNRSVHLSLLECQLLRYFIANKNQMLARTEILKSIWSERKVSERTIDTHIVSLRRKTKGFNYDLATLYGAGYILKSKDGYTA